MAEPRKITNCNTTKNNNSVNFTNFSSTEKPISNAYNIYLVKEKQIHRLNKKVLLNKNINNSPICKNRKMPIFSNLFYSPGRVIKMENIQRQNKKYFNNQIINKSFEYSTSLIPSIKKEDIISSSNNIINPDIYIRKTSFIASHKRCLSHGKINGKNGIFKNNITIKNLTLSPNKIGTFYNKSLKNTEKKVDNGNNPKIININLYNGKNNYIENNILNKIYMNKNKAKNTVIERRLNNIINNNINNYENITLTERKPIQRRSNYSFFYNSNNNSIRKIEKNQNNKINIGQKNPKKRINILPKVQKKQSKKYNVSLIIKIQSVVRGYLLNKKLDKYLRHYIHIKNGIKIIENNYKKEIFNILKKEEIKKRYYTVNNRIKNTCKNLDYNGNNEKNEKNLLQSKIKELINEKNELQNNYDNLKEFIKQFNELIKEKQEMKKEIDKLTKEKNELLIQLNSSKHFYTKSLYRRYIIDRQSDLNIIAPKKIDLIYPIYNNSKKNENKNVYFTLGNDGRDNDEISPNNNIEIMRNNKLNYLILKKEYNNKFILFKYFVKFNYLRLSNKNKNNKKNQVNVIKRIFSNNDENKNINNYNSKRMKTSSENYYLYTDRKSLNLQMEKNLSNLAKNILAEENRGNIKKINFWKK